MTPDERFEADEKDRLLDIMTELRQKYDALLADNERLRKALEKAIEFVPAGYGIERECWSAIHATPAQSLARIRNQVRDEIAQLSASFSYMNGDGFADAIRATKEPE